MKEEKKDKSIINKDASTNSHVVRHDFIDETLDVDEFLEFLWILNKRRPYRLSDFKEQHFIPEELKQLLN